MTTNTKRTYENLRREIPAIILLDNDDPPEKPETADEYTRRLMRKLVANLTGNISEYNSL